jgi:alcohol dehydrogenase
MVTREQIPEIARAALNDGSIFYNPEEVDFDDLRMVIFAAWTGEPLDVGRIRKG